MAMLKIVTPKKMRQDLKRVKKRGKDLRELQQIVITLADGKKLDRRYRDHILSGDWQGYHECHVEPDWLLIYKIAEGQLFLVRTGSHADLFK